jgi:hypothetical protein
MLPITPGDAGFAPELEARLDRVIAEKRVWNLHGVVVLRNDRLVLERYFEGEDQARGIGAIGRVNFTARSRHGSGWTGWPMAFSRKQKSFIHGRTFAFPSPPKMGAECPVASVRLCAGGAG